MPTARRYLRGHNTPSPTTVIPAKAGIHASFSERNGQMKEGANSSETPFFFERIATHHRGQGTLSSLRSRPSAAAMLDHLSTPQSAREPGSLRVEPDATLQPPSADAIPDSRWRDFRERRWRRRQRIATHHRARHPMFCLYLVIPSAPTHRHSRGGGNPRHAADDVWSCVDSRRSLSRTRGERKDGSR